MCLEFCLDMGWSSKCASDDEEPPAIVPYGRSSVKPKSSTSAPNAEAKATTKKIPDAKAVTPKAKPKAKPKSAPRGPNTICFIAALW